MRSYPRTLMACMALVCTLGLIAGCSDATTPGDGSVTPCTEDEECPTGQYCQSGLCADVVVSCEDGGTCPDGMTCVDGVCQPDNDGGVDGDGGDGTDGDGGDDDPDINIIDPSLSDDIYQLNFGNVLLGEPVVMQIRLENTGQSDLRIMQLNFEMGTDVEDFSVPQETLDALPVVLGPGQQTNFDVIYVASDGRTDHGILDIISNDPDEALVQIHLLSEFKGEARVEVAPRILPFGDIPLGATSQPLSFILANQGTGNAVLSVDDVRFEILSNPNFSMSITDSDGQAAVVPTLLNNGDFLDVSISFMPQSDGLHADNVLVLTNDDINPAIYVEVNGTGVVGDLLVDPSPINMDRVRVGGHGEVAITITNSGGAEVSLTGIALQDAGPELVLSSVDVDLIDLPNTPRVLAAAESVVLTLSFDPLDEGLETASLVVDNTSADPQRVVAVSALGYIPASVETVPAPPELSFGNVQLDFGQGLTEQVTMDVIIRNLGGEPLQILDIQRTGAGLDFSFNPSSISPIDVGLEVPLHVVFEPSTLGAQAASIQVDTNDPDIELDGVTGRFRIDMQANGIDPNVFISPTSKAFGEVYVGQAVVQQFSIQNAGFGPLVLESIDLSPGSSGAFTLLNVPALPMVIANAMMVVNFDVQFTPSSLGEELGVIEVVSSDIGSLSVMLDLSGTGADCPANFIDCNGNPQDGCEVTCIPSGAELCNYLDDDCDCDTDEDYDTNNDPAHCGFCNNNCSYPHATPSCINGNCEMLTCSQGWDDCNAWDGDGCETQTDTEITDCGSCGNICDFPNASATCLAGICVMGSCNAGFANCDGSSANGCEVNTVNDVDNCNGCGNRCLYNNASGRCLGGTCDLDSCLPDYANCNFNDADGCEVNLMNDPDNCNSCGNDCPVAGGTPVCSSGICGVSDCNTGWADCDANPADCEQDIANDPSNCGGCGTDCESPADNTSWDCSNQTCIVDSCDPGWGDCNNQDPDGCETNTTNTNNDCGFCGNVCSFDNGAASCVGSGCVLGVCDGGYFDVDNNPLNGCECAEDNISNLCNDATITDLNTIAPAETRAVVANLIPDDLGANRDEDWYTFTALDNQTDDINNGFDTYHLSIDFDPVDGNPDGMYSFDVYRSPNTGHGCADKGTADPNPCIDDQSYDFRTTTQANTTCHPGAMPNIWGRICINGSSRYWLRVYRSGSTVNCSDYKVNITFVQ